MKREKITELKEFLYLYTTERENVFTNDTNKNISEDATAQDLKYIFEKYDYYYQPQEKKRVLAEFYCWDDNWACAKLLIFELKNGKSYRVNNSEIKYNSYDNIILKKGSEFYEDGSEYKGGVE